jgi:hypothetical protein
VKRLERGMRMCAAAALVGAVAWLAGCQEPLLAPTDERTPYDRYDAIRNQAADQYVFDEYGRRRPNLQERLMPRE